MTLRNLINALYFRFLCLCLAVEVVLKSYSYSDSKITEVDLVKLFMNLNCVLSLEFFL